MDNTAVNNLRVAVRNTQGNLNRARSATQSKLRSLQKRSERIGARLAASLKAPACATSTYATPSPEQMMTEGVAWMNGSDTGLSSKAMMCAVLNIPNESNFGPYQWPSDPSDLGRCLRLIRKLPWARQSLSILATHSARWKRLAAKWDELTSIMEQEVGIDWEKGSQAPLTYDAMKKILHTDDLPF